jgi:hypothetical protein
MGIMEIEAQDQENMEGFNPCRQKEKTALCNDTQFLTTYRISGG